MMNFAIKMYEEPEILHEEAKKSFEKNLGYARGLQDKGLLD